MEFGQEKYIANQPMKFCALGKSIVLSAVFVVFGSSCGSSEPIANKVSNGPSANQQQSTLNQIPQGEPTVNNDPSGGSAVNSQVQPPANRVVQKIEQIRAEAANKAMPSSIGKNSRPAPEDSTITVQLTDVARETREFNKHPVLLRVEKIHDGKDGAVKIVLRDGRTFDRPGKSIQRLDQITSAEILQIAGISIPEPKSSSPVTNPLKKPDQ